MRIKLMGVRGSMPSPSGNKEYRDKMRSILYRAVEAGLNDVSQINGFINKLPEHLQFNYGGNTTCAAVTSGSGNLYILDCGTGLKALGDDIVTKDFGKGNDHIRIFLTHAHWDHIQGIPFFKPLYIPGNIIEFYSPYENLREILQNQMKPPCFPAPFEGTASTKEFHLIKSGPLNPEEGLTIDFYPLRHPGGSYAYRFKEGGKTFIFATDAEFTGGDLEKAGNEADFFLNADLLILDSQYTLDEHFTKFEWGHTSYTVAVNCGARWGVRHLVLTHHEPGNNDKKLRQIHIEAIKHRNNMKIDKPVIHIAREGMIFNL